MILSTPNSCLNPSCNRENPLRLIHSRRPSKPPTRKCWSSWPCSKVSWKLPSKTLPQALHQSNKAAILLKVRKKWETVTYKYHSLIMTLLPNSRSKNGWLKYALGLFRLLSIIISHSKWHFNRRKFFAQKTSSKICLSSLKSINWQTSKSKTSISTSEAGSFNTCKRNIP